LSGKELRLWKILDLVKKKEILNMIGAAIDWGMFIYIGSLL
jgi:hypothetical protein